MREYHAERGIWPGSVKEEQNIQFQFLGAEWKVQQIGLGNGGINTPWAKIKILKRKYYNICCATPVKKKKVKIKM